MLPVTLSDEQWQQMLPITRAHPNAYLGQEDECRRFLSAVLRMVRSGAQWRLLPPHYGYWNAVYPRFARCSEQGVFEHLHQALSDDADLQHLLIDSTIIGAHPCAAGASRKVAAKRHKPEGAVAAASALRFRLRWMPSD
jgi:transposase